MTKSKFNVWLFSSLIVGGLLFSGCGKDPSSAVRVTGGEELSSTHPYGLHSVAIMREIRTDIFSNTCSASLLTPTTIITAAHCVSRVNNERIYAYFGIKTPDYLRAEGDPPVSGELLSKDMNAVLVKAIVIPKTFMDTSYTEWMRNTRGGEMDVAVLHLERSAPVHVTPVTLIEKDYIFTKNQPLIISSYGRGAGGTKSGRLRSINVNYLGAESTNKGQSGYIKSSGSRNGATCFGDSGGPVYIQENNQLILAGIVNLVRNNCTGFGSNLDIRKHLDWIKESAGKIDESIDPIIDDSKIVRNLMPSDYNSFLEYCQSSDRTYSEKQAMLSMIRIAKSKKLESLTDKNCEELADTFYIGSAFDLEKQIPYELPLSTLAPYAVLANLNNFTRIQAYSGDVKDLSPLSNVFSLDKIKLVNQQITDLTPLKNLYGLQSLDLSGNQVRRLDSLSRIGSLYTLNLSRNGIRKLSNLDGFKRLSTLDLSENEISNIGFLSSIKNIRNINLSENQIVDVSSLGNLKKLNSLDISHNQIKDIRPLKGLIAVRKLNLSHNHIDQLESLKSLPKLEKVDLSYNNITSLESLQGIHRLWTLDLRGNPIPENQRTCPFEESSFYKCIFE